MTLLASGAAVGGPHASRAPVSSKWPVSCVSGNPELFFIASEIAQWFARYEVSFSQSAGHMAGPPFGKSPFSGSRKAFVISFWYHLFPLCSLRQLQIVGRSWVVFLILLSFPSDFSTYIPCPAFPPLYPLESSASFHSTEFSYLSEHISCISLKSFLHFCFMCFF